MAGAYREGVEPKSIPRTFPILNSEENKTRSPSESPKRRGGEEVNLLSMPVLKKVVTDNSSKTGGVLSSREKYAR